MPNTRTLLLAILLLGFALRLVVVQTPFLGEWDERFHALVAKNLMAHPLKPTLYDDPVLEYDYREWSANHVWLSKPPLALWFMAGSMSLLGTSVLAMRLPALLISVASIYLTFLIGRRLFDSRVALMAALLHAIHGMTLEVTCGRLSSDHVDSFFLFFFQWAILLIIHYFDTKVAAQKIKLAAVIGLVAGLAFLTKWIAAGFIPLVWLAIYLTRRRLRHPAELLLHGATMAAVVALTVAPLLVFLFWAYPLEADYFIKATFLPIQTTIHGHQHPWYFFFSQSRIVFGELIYLPMLWLVYKVFKKARRGNSSVVFILIFLPLLPLTMMETKRNTYILLAAVGFFLLTALFFRYLQVYGRKLNIPKPLVGLVLVLLMALPARYSFERIKPFKTYPEEQQAVARIQSIPLDEGAKTVIFNEPNPIRTMFYRNHVTAYAWTPSSVTIDSIRANGYVVLVQEAGRYRRVE